MSGYVPASLRRLVAERASFLCEYCLIHEDDTFLGCQIEHIISEKHLGPTDQANLAYACVFCNRAKGTDIAALHPQTGDLTRLFNPRTDPWHLHFKLTGAAIAGISDIGAATVRLLALNHPDRLLERETLIAVGRFPSPAAFVRMTPP